MWKTAGIWAVIQQMEDLFQMKTILKKIFNVASLVMLIIITWLKWYLLGFATVKLLFFLL